MNLLTSKARVLRSERGYRVLRGSGCYAIYVFSGDAAYNQQCGCGEFFHGREGGYRCVADLLVGAGGVRDDCTRQVFGLAGGEESVGDFGVIGAGHVED